MQPAMGTHIEQRYLPRPTLAYIHRSLITPLSTKGPAIPGGWRLDLASDGFAGSGVAITKYSILPTAIPQLSLIGRMSLSEI